MLIATFALLAQIDPAHRTPLTLYHEHQAEISVGLANQDTGDIGGDAYFVLRGLLLPIECADPHASKFDCNNPEENSTHNVVSQHSVAVDNRYGEYASCNEDPATGKYSCVCGQWPHVKPCNKPAVGRVDVAQRESRYPIAPGSADWHFWRTNLAIKTGGYWYSTLPAGMCPQGGAADASSCTWKLLNTSRVIVAGCLETRVAEAVQKYDTTCFAGCAQPHNASSPCVARCYMQTILGPSGGERKINATEGMPLPLLEQAWSGAFASTDPTRGGCPDAGEDGADYPMSWHRRKRAA